MPALLTRGAATAWLVALVAAIAPATALAADPVPPPADPGTPPQGQPATPPPADTCVPRSASCAPADQPPAPDPPLGPSGPAAADPPALPAKPAPVAEPATVVSEPAVVTAPKPAPLTAVAPQPAREEQPVHHDAPSSPPADRPDQRDEHQHADKPDKPDTPKPSGDKPKPRPGYDDKPGNHDNHDNHNNGNNGNNGNNHERDPVVFDRETIRLGGCRDFTVATAKATFERIRYEKDRFKVTVRHLAVPEGTVVTVRVDGRVAGTLTIDQDGNGKLVRRGDHLPKFLRLDGNERVTISNDAGDVLLSQACVQKNGDDGSND